MTYSIAQIATEVKNSLCKKCWYVSCGGAASSTFQLALGDKVPRGVSIRNPVHSEDFRNFEGEANLLVWCSWRLDSPHAPITSSDDTVENVERGLEELVGRTIVDVGIDLLSWDLDLIFTGGFRLRVFCDHVPGDPSFDGNWQLSLTTKMVAIGVGSKYAIEPRTP